MGWAVNEKIKEVSKKEWRGKTVQPKFTEVQSNNIGSFDSAYANVNFAENTTNQGRSVLGLS